MDLRKCQRKAAQGEPPLVAGMKVGSTDVCLPAGRPPPQFLLAASNQMKAEALGQAGASAPHLQDPKETSESMTSSRIAHLLCYLEHLNNF